LGGPLGQLKILGRQLAAKISLFLTEKDLIFPLKELKCSLANGRAAKEKNTGTEISILVLCNNLYS